MNVKPIRSEADYDQALERVEALWGASAGTPEGDELDVLIPLVEVYEHEHYPIDLPDPIDAIKFRLEQQGKDYRSLIGILGQRTRVYEVMRRARPLSLNMIRKLHSQLGIPAEVLIRPPKGTAIRHEKDRHDTSAEPERSDEQAKRAGRRRPAGDDVRCHARMVVPAKKACHSAGPLGKCIAPSAQGARLRMTKSGLRRRACSVSEHAFS